MNIKTLGTEETHWDEPVACTLYDERGEAERDSAGNEVQVDVVSEFAAPVRRIDREHKTRYMSLVRKYGRAEHIPEADTNRLDDERIAASITGWRGFEEAPGTPFPYSQQNAVAVVTALRVSRPKQLRQIAATIAEHASFFEQASPN